MALNYFGIPHPHSQIFFIFKLLVSKTAAERTAGILMGTCFVKHIVLDKYSVENVTENQTLLNVSTIKSG